MTTTTAAEESTTTEAMDEGEMAEPSGAACASVPADGAGSFSGMAQDPAATAASNNPALSTLVTVVQTADLVDTLNGDGPFTIFAPANAAFEAIPADTLHAVLADQEQLTSILTYHVIAGEQMSSADLVEAGSAVTVQGDDLQFTEERRFARRQRLRQRRLCRRAHGQRDGAHHRRRPDAAGLIRGRGTSGSPSAGTTRGGWLQPSAPRSASGAGSSATDVAPADGQRRRGGSGSHGRSGQGCFG